MLTRAQLDAFVARWKRDQHRDSGDATGIAVVEVASLDEAGWARLCADGTTRIFSDGGVLEVQGGELVIVELAPGVSARDLQAKVAPTLKVRHDVVEMTLVE